MQMCSGYFFISILWGKVIIAGWVCQAHTAHHLNPSLYQVLFLSRHCTGNLDIIPSNFREGYELTNSRSRRQLKGSLYRILARLLGNEAIQTNSVSGLAEQARCDTTATTQIHNCSFTISGCFNLPVIILFLCYNQAFKKNLLATIEKIAQNYSISKLFF